VYIYIISAQNEPCISSLPSCCLLWKWNGSLLILCAPFEKRKYCTHIVILCFSVCFVTSVSRNDRWNKSSLHIYRDVFINVHRLSLIRETKEEERRKRSSYGLFVCVRLPTSQNAVAPCGWLSVCVCICVYIYVCVCSAVKWRHCVSCRLQRKCIIWTNDMEMFTAPHVVHRHVTSWPCWPLVTLHWSCIHSFIPIHK